MTRTFRVNHRTEYRYGATMTDGYTVACLVPRPTRWQRVVESEVRLDPPASEWDSFLDPFGNLVNQFGLHEPHDDIAVEATSVVELDEQAMPHDDTPWEGVVARLDGLEGDLAVEVGAFRADSALIDTAALGAPLHAIADSSFTPGRPIVEAVAEVCSNIFTTFEFDPHFSDLSTPLVDVLAARRGVCQDFAHLAIGCLRSVGLAARYVSGYIETVPPPGEERLVGADASHAWCSVWMPEAGWVDFDPTNGHLPVNDHVTVAWGRDYGDVTPVRGVMIGPSTAQTLTVSVDVARV
ncbi:MAG: transglutaminase family protein [Ilumatobacter sp.]|uniref:transglutaminase family protein n=1 Tax=Ilumatobacter sp. TaxID=1967498 RepID=UPI0026109054|nr:transglutaminase family protein [Ilumatobacter sp.]MDJ0769960.1 transglutaminase family protein [Ilumatobacter sp.]